MTHAHGAETDAAARDTERHARGAEVATGPTAAVDVRPRPTMTTAQLRGLQRSVGNRTVTRSLQRDTPTKFADPPQKATGPGVEETTEPAKATSPDAQKALAPAPPPAPPGGTGSPAGTGNGGGGPQKSTATAPTKATAPVKAPPAKTTPPTTAPPTKAPPPVKASPLPLVGSGGGGGGTGTGPTPAGSGTGPTTGGAPPSLDKNGPTGNAPGGNGTGGGPAAPGSATDGTFDFTEWALGDAGNVVRTGLELSRFIPGWGMLGGAAADILTTVQDVHSVPEGPENDGMRTAMEIRGGLNVINGAIGHVSYVNQLITDGLAGSVVGAEFSPLSAGVNEGVSAAKVFVDSVITGMDIAIEAGAIYKQRSDPAHFDAWQGIIDGYQANLVGDVVSLIMDSISLASAGVSNTTAVDQIKTPLTLGGAILASGKNNFIAFVAGMWNVWGGAIIGGGKSAAGNKNPENGPAPQGAGLVQPPAPVQRLEAGDAAQAALYEAVAANLDATSLAGRAAWATTNAGIDMLVQQATQSVAEMDAVSRELFDGKSTFEVIRDATVQAMGMMREKIDGLQTLASTATNASENAASIRAGATDLLATIDALTVPNVTIPEADLGDNALADAAESVANFVGGAANAGLELVIGQVRDALDEAKAGVSAPIESVRDQAESLGEFLSIAAQLATDQVGTVRGYVANFEQAMSQTTGFENAADTIMQQISQITGGPEFRVQDLRDLWNSIPPMFDDVDRLAAGLHAHSRQLLAGATGGSSPAGPSAAPPPDAPPSDGTGATDNPWIN